MADKVIVTKSKMTALADAIRSKTGSTGTMNIDSMKTAVEGISGGGSVNVEWENAGFIPQSLTDIMSVYYPIEKFYWNTSLSIEEVVEIINSATNIEYQPTGSGDFEMGDLIKIGIPSDYSLDKTLDFCVIKSASLNFLGVANFAFMISLMGGTLEETDIPMLVFTSNALPEMGLNVTGWNQQLINPFIINKICYIKGFVNEKLYSIIPYEKFENYQLTGEYNGQDLYIVGHNQIIDIEALLNQNQLPRKINIVDPNQLIINQNLVNSSGIFSGLNLRRLEEIFKDIDVSAVDSLTGVFEDNTWITTIPEGSNVSKLFNENITDMNRTFYNCANLTQIPTLSVKNLISMRYAFSGCSKLLSLNIETGLLTNITRAFSYCSVIESIETLTLDPTIESADINLPFYNCKALKNLKIKNIPISLVVSDSPLLTVESLVGLCQECINVNSSQTLTVGTANLEKLASVYVKLTGEAEEDENYPKLPMVQCESTDEGAMLISDYMTSKNWTLA